MGCDIHGWVEKKVGQKWVAIKELEDRDRNHLRFAKLAGVRTYTGDGYGFPEPKGVPTDASDTTRYHIEKWDSDGHSHSWMHLDEALRIFKETQSKEHYSEYSAFGIDLGNNERCKCCGQFLPKAEYRLVFWFDN